MRARHRAPLGRAGRLAGIVGLTTLLGLVHERARAEVAASETESTVALSLDQAVERALDHSPRMEESVALERASLAASRGARGERWPVIELSAGYTRSSDVPELTIDQPPAPPRTLFPNIPSSYTSRVEARWPLWTGGRIGGTIRAAEGEERAASLDRQATRAALVLETTIGYWSLVLAREEERVLERAIAAFEAHLADAANREALGLAPRNEVLSVRVERDQAELARLGQHNRATVAHANLARLVGLPLGSRLEPADSLGPAAGAGGDGETLDALLATATTTRPEVGAAEARLDGALGRVAAERSGRLPTLSIVTGYEAARPNRRFLPLEDAWNDGWDAGVGLSWRLFDGTRTSASIGEARERAEALRQATSDVEERVRFEVTQRWLERETARAALAVATGNVEAAEESQRVAHDRYLEGVSLSSELLDAEVALLEAGLQRTEAIAELRFADARLTFAVGR